MSKLAHQVAPTPAADLDLATKAYADSAGGGGSSLGVGAWSLIEHYEVTGSAETDITISSLDGNTSKRYFVVYDILYGGNPTAVNYDIYPNGSAISSGITERLISANATEQAAEYANLWRFAVTQGDRIVGSLELGATTGQRRYFTAKDAMMSSAFTDGIVNVYAGAWNDTSTNITSLQFHSTETGGFGIGTTITVFELNTTAPSRIAGETILGSASDTISVTGLDGDAHGDYIVDLHIKIPGSSAFTATAHPNGETSNLLGALASNFDASPTAKTAWEIFAAGGQSAREAKGRLMLTAARTQDGETVLRSVRAEVILVYTASPYCSFYHFGGYYNDATANLTSFDIVTTLASGFSAGSRVTVRKA